MAICPAGHHTNAADFCDTCGLPVAAGQPVTTTIVPGPEAELTQPVICPHCQTPNVADALFCEACGYDFTTGTTPVAAVEPEASLPPADTDAVEAPAADPASGETASSETGTEVADIPPGDGSPAVGVTDPAVPEPEASAAPDPAEQPERLQRPAVDWVAELWIDPDWYAAQGSSDPMPSPALPDIVPLIKPSNLIGRVSHSRGIFPDIDCDLDTGCSRRHAMLSTDGGRWWIEDLDSANGTFVGAAAGPLPGMPIPQGRVELNPGQRIYVGAWTRIVVRKATEDEKVAFA